MTCVVLCAVLHDNHLTHTDLKPENILFVNSDSDITYNPQKVGVSRAVSHIKRSSPIVLICCKQNNQIGLQCEMVCKVFAFVWLQFHIWSFNFDSTSTSGLKVTVYNLTLPTKAFKIVL